MSLDVLNGILDCGVAAVLRAESDDLTSNVIEALIEGGVSIIEITMTMDNAVEMIRLMKERFADRAIIGAGTVLDPETARAVILAGAEFVVSPILNLEMITLCKRYDKVVCPGAYTPTEILTAWQAGADIVKVFPANTLGPGFFKAVKAPLPQIRIMPTGGVSIENVGEFIKSGACAVGAGGNLVNKTWISEGRFDKLTDMASKYCNAVQAARS